MGLILLISLILILAGSVGGGWGNGPSGLVGLLLW